MNTWTGVFLLAAVTAAGAAPGEEAPCGRLEGLRAERARRLEALQRPVIFNNDGCDAWNYPGPWPPTPERFLDVRTTVLPHTAVTMVSYCPLSVSFGGFTHRTREGRIMAFDNSATSPGRNATAELLRRGTDPLELVSRFCREQGLGILFSLRMNDVHDQTHRPDRPHPHWNPFKENHPHWLMGSWDRRPPHGAWSAVDYAVPEIRDLAFRFCEEACRAYDLDGIELDFFRHLGFFRSTAWGDTATDKEREMMTGLVRRIRRMTEEVGLEKNHPLWLAVRVPDAPGYAYDLGLDVEAWMREGLVDIVIGGGDFRLRPWAESVAWCQPYGVRFFAGFTDWRVTREGAPPGMERLSDPFYRAEAMNAWAAGVDGIYLFNEYRPAKDYLRTLNDPDALRVEEKIYAVSRRIDDPERYLATGGRYLERTVLSPNDPLLLSRHAPLAIPITMAEEFEAARDAGYRPRIACLLRADEEVTARLEASFNGKALALAALPGQAGWVKASLQPEWIRGGVNRVQVGLRPPEEENGREHRWDVERSFRTRPSMPEQLPWRRLYNSSARVEEVRDGALFLADQGREKHDFPHLVYPWRVEPGERIAAEVEVRVVESDNPLAVCLRFSDGRAVEYLTLEPGGIGLHFAGKAHAMDTTSDFRVYRVEIRNRDIRVYVDGVLRIDAPGAYVTCAQDEEHFLPFMGRRTWNRRCLLLGSASGPGTGAALWRGVRLTSNVPRLHDLLVHVRYAPEETPAQPHP